MQGFDEIEEDIAYQVELNVKYRGYTGQTDGNGTENKKAGRQENPFGYSIYGCIRSFEGSCGEVYQGETLYPRSGIPYPRCYTGFHYCLAGAF